MREFNTKSRPKDKEKKTFERANALHEGRELTLDTFKSEIFPKKTTQRKIQIN